MFANIVTFVDRLQEWISMQRFAIYIHYALECFSHSLGCLFSLHPFIVLLKIKL